MIQRAIHESWDPKLRSFSKPQIHLSAQVANAGVLKPSTRRSLVGWPLRASGSRLL